MLSGPIALALALAAPASEPEGAIAQADSCVPAGIPVEQGFITADDGVRLHYRKLGRGRPVAIYLHGGPGGSIYNGGCELAPLARSHAIVLYDQRGGGRSDLVAEADRLELADHVADLEAVRRHFGIGRVALIGLSWGSALAASYAAAHPERVGRLMLLSPMPIASTPFGQQRSAAVDGASGPELMERRRQLAQALRAATAPDEVVALCRRLLAEAPLPYSLDPSRHRSPNGCDFPAEVIRNRETVRRHTIASLGEWDFRPLLARIAVPVLVVEGARTVIPLDSTRLWAASAREGRLLLVPDAGHEVGLDRPEALLAAAHVFLGGRWPDGSSRGDAGAPPR